MYFDIETVTAGYGKLGDREKVVKVRERSGIWGKKS